MSPKKDQLGNKSSGPTILKDETVGSGEPDESMDPSAMNLTVEELPTLGRDVQGYIGKQLRAHYDALVDQQVPDDLLKLIEKLAKSEQIVGIKPEDPGT